MAAEVTVFRRGAGRLGHLQLSIIQPPFCVIRALTKSKWRLSALLISSLNMANFPAKDFELLGVICD